jgi:glutamyl-tRNA reductase
MKLQLVGCSHHQSPLALREKLAFSTQQAQEALDKLREKFPGTESVVLSTCNRVEVYTATEEPARAPTHHEMMQFLADFHHVPLADIFNDLFERTGEDAVLHLFSVAAGLDSMVVGEPQILAQVKQAYDLARTRHCAGPLTNAVFQAALRVAKRVATETNIARKRVSIPSVAVGDFARNIFESFGDKKVLVIGAGEMGEETVRYLIAEGARHVTVVNRSLERAERLAEEFHGRAVPWEGLDEQLVEADLVVSTTGAEQPIVTLHRYRTIERLRYQRPLVVLDLAIPRDFDPAIEREGLAVYLYSIDDLKEACTRNLREREKEMPAAMQIVEDETAAFMADLNRRATGPIIQRLRQGWQGPKEDELSRLFARLPELDQRERAEIAQAFDRLINKLLHPPLESLRDESREGIPHALLEALKTLFRLRD